MSLCVSDEILKHIPPVGYGLILGDIRSGKSAIGYGILESIQGRKKCVFAPPPALANLLPKHISPVHEIEEIENGSVVLFDEAYLSFYSREFMKDSNKLIDVTSGIAGHKDILLIFVTQQTRRLDISIIASARFILFKKPSLLQSRFDRPQLRAITGDVFNAFKSVSNHMNSCYIITPDFEGMIEKSNTLPEWWSDEISKSYAYEGGVVDDTPQFIRIKITERYEFLDRIYISGIDEKGKKINIDALLE